MALDVNVWHHTSSDLRLILERLDKIMATVQELQDTIAAERAEVGAKLTEMTALIQALRDQVAAGTAATPEQLDELVLAVKDIFTPDPVPPPA